MVWQNRSETTGESLVWSIDSATSAVLILVPIAVGLGASRAFLLHRSVEVLSGFPFRGQVRSLFSLGMPIIGGVFLGIASVAGGFTIMLAMRDVVVTAPAFAPLAPALLQIICFTYLGIGLGAVAPFELTGPVLAIGMYCLMAFGFANVDVLFDYIGATSGWFGQSVYSPRGLLVLALSFLGVLAVGLTFMIGSLTESRLLPLLGGMLGLAVVLTLPVQVRIPLFEEAGDNAWSCEAPAEIEREVCVPREQEARLEEIAPRIVPYIVRLEKVDARMPEQLRLTDVLPLQSFLDTDTDSLELGYGLSRFAVSCYTDLSDAQYVQWSDSHPMESAKLEQNIDLLAQWTASGSRDDEPGARKAVQALSVCEGAPE